MKIQNDKQVEILNSHYNETFKVVEIVWSQRNRTALYIYLLSAFLLLSDLHQPIINNYLKDPNLSISTQQIYLIGLFGLLGMCVLLTQRTIFLDKHYIYMQGLEDRIAYLSGYPIIPREGKFYKFEDVDENNRRTMPIRYDILYDLFLVVLILAVLWNLWSAVFIDSLNKWWFLIENGNQYNCRHKVTFILLTLGFIYVLVSFFFFRSKISEAAKRENEKLKEELIKAYPEQTDS